MDEEKSVGSSSSSSENKPNYNMLSTLRKPLCVADLGRECLALHHTFGVDTTKRGNLYMIENEKIIYATSNAVVFEDVKSGTKKFLMGIDEGGVGCVAVHPSRSYFAVGGKGFQPRIFIYSYPAMEVVKILNGGAERGYSCLTFNADGDTIASVSMSPDFMLTIWDWQEERMGLHSKAFGQDIFSVRFSLDDPKRLTTSGTGHIRFWKMASTFTGLKLQGSIGKFGKIDLSDIDSFVELPDGKVVSGTESGDLLLWEGNFIKCRFTQLGGKLCHSGLVTYLELDRKEKCIISAATDGYIRWWDLSAVDMAEVDADVSMDFELFPMAEIRLGDNTEPGLGIKSMVDSGNIGNIRSFVILDNMGRTQTLGFYPSNPETKAEMNLVQTVVALTDMEIDDPPTSDKIFFNFFHSAAITGLDTCPIDHLVATCSTDGTVRLLNYLTRREVCNKTFNSPVTCLKWVPPTVDPSGKLVVVGFADGAVRVLGLCEDPSDPNQVSFVMKAAFKPHNALVSDLAFSESGNMLATTGKDGIIFFFKVRSKDKTLDDWIPMKFVTVAGPGEENVNKKNPTSCERLSWSPSSDSHILCSCTDSVLREIFLEELLAVLNDDSKGRDDEGVVSYEGFYDIKEIRIKVPQGKAAPAGAVTPTAAAPAAATADGQGASADSKAGSAEAKTAPIEEKPQEDAVTFLPLKINRGIYSFNRSAELVTAGMVGQRPCLHECSMISDVPVGELMSGVYSKEMKASDKDPLLRSPMPTSMRYSWSKNFVAVGLSDGVATLRPSNYLETVMRAVSNNGAAGGVTYSCVSFDDRFLFSAGADSILSVHKVRIDIVNDNAEKLSGDLQAEVFGDAIIKPAPKTTKENDSERKYLTFVSETDETEEDMLFDPNILMKKPEDILSDEKKPNLMNPDEESEDLPENAYSIQDEKLKMEEKAKEKAADQLKGRVKASIKVLQQDYKKVLEENIAIPEVARVKKSDMKVDEEYFNILADEGRAMVEEVRRECEYDSEKAVKLREKISSRMMSGLRVEEMTLAALHNPKAGRQPKSVVKSLRAKALDSHVQEILKEVAYALRDEELNKAQQKANQIAKEKALTKIDEMKQRKERKEEDDKLNVSATATLDKLQSHSRGDADNGESANHDARTTNRIKRKKEIASHTQEKPREDEDDIRDVTAIEVAEKTIGDYKLKIADDYKVPEEQRINVTKKISQMALLEESMLQMRLQYDERFLALRNLKKEIIFSISRDNRRIKEIDVELQQEAISNDVWEPRLDPAEFPDDANEVTAGELEEFKKVRENQPNWELAIAPMNSIAKGCMTNIVKDPVSGTYQAVPIDAVDEYDVVEEDKDDADQSTSSLAPSYSLPLSDQAIIDYVPSRTDRRKEYELDDTLLSSYIQDKESEEAKAIKRLEEVVPVLRNANEALKNRMFQEEQSALQIALNAERKCSLAYERKMLLQKIDENVEAFRFSIDELRVDRHEVTTNLKMAELKLLVLYQEYQLLQTFEQRDFTLQQKQERCKSEASENISIAKENKEKLAVKMEELSVWHDKLAAISEEFKSLLPDNHPYLESLSKIFRKKVKRSKGGAMDDDEEDEEEEEDDEDEDDDDDEEIEDICPPGCDQTLFEKILELRDRKTDIDEATQEIQKGTDELKKTIERLRQREKQIDKDGLQTETEVQQFQLQKQAGLNQLRMVVPLQISQLYMFEDSGMFTGPAKEAVEGEEGEMGESEMEPSSIVTAEERALVSELTLKSHCLFSKSQLVRLKDRIDELYSEIDQAKVDFKQLHRTRGVLTRECENKGKEIELWSSRCKDLQMLKFGKEIDLDELEANSDRSKELEAEDKLKKEEEAYKLKLARQNRETQYLLEKLQEATVRNTELLNEVGDLTDVKLSVSRELNMPQNIQHSSKLDNFKESEETKRIQAYIKFQAKELESLRTELNMLKRKEAPPVLGSTYMSQTMPPIPSFMYEGDKGGSANDLVLPPIPKNKMSTGR